MNQGVSRENPEGLTAREMLDRFRNDGSCEKALLALLDECENLRRGWRPIETAPKDGAFMLCVAESGHVNIMQWCVDGYWRSNTKSPVGYWGPTHWRPLPDPPDAAISENAARQGGRE